MPASAFVICDAGGDLAFGTSDAGPFTLVNAAGVATKGETLAQLEALWL